jgi:hypothetical protein
LLPTNVTKVSESCCPGGKYRRSFPIEIELENKEEKFEGYGKRK